MNLQQEIEKRKKASDKELREALEKLKESYTDEEIYEACKKLKELEKRGKVNDNK